MYALIVYRCNGEYLYSTTEYESIVDVEQAISNLEAEEEGYTYAVYGDKLTVKITPPTAATFSVF